MCSHCDIDNKSNRILLIIFYYDPSVLNVSKSLEIVQNRRKFEKIHHKRLRQKLYNLPDSTKREVHLVAGKVSEFISCHTECKEPGITAEVILGWLRVGGGGDRTDRILDFIK